VLPEPKRRTARDNESQTRGHYGEISMRELTSGRAIVIKGILFLLLGLLSFLLLVLEHPTVRLLVLLLLTVWSFCRFYYFAFYVMERYVDSSYRFSGLFSLARHFLSKHRS